MVLDSSSSVGPATLTSDDLIHYWDSGSSRWKYTTLPAFYTALGGGSSVLAFAAPVIDFAGDAFQTVSLTGDITFTTSNRVAARSKTIRILSDSSVRTFTFPAWVFVGTKPTTIAASKTAILTLTAFGTADTDIVAAYAVEA